MMRILLILPHWSSIIFLIYIWYWHIMFCTAELLIFHYRDIAMKFSFCISSYSLYLCFLYFHVYTPVYRHIIIDATVYRHHCVILPCCFYVIFAFCLLLFWLWAWNPFLRRFCSYYYLTSAIISSTIITTLIPIHFLSY